MLTPTTPPTPEEVNNHFERYLRSGFETDSENYIYQVLGFIHAIDLVNLQTPEIRTYRAHFIGCSHSDNKALLKLWLSLKGAPDVQAP